MPITRLLLYLHGAQGLQTLRDLKMTDAEVEVVVPAGFDNTEIIEVCSAMCVPTHVRAKGKPLGVSNRFDLLVSSAFQFRILPCEYSAPRFGGVNLHAAVLPKYSGKHSLAWALINGESRLGVTLHRLAEEFDAGEILRIEYVDVTDEMSYADIS